MPPIADHYATLGVAPRSEDVVIRAAYLALMHRYHPDKSSLPASAERAQAIIAAFAVLGDPQKRLRYDWDRRRAAEALAEPLRRRLTGGQRGLAAAAAALVLIIPLALMRPFQTGADPQAKSDQRRAAPSPASAPAPPPAEAPPRPLPPATAAPAIIPAVVDPAPIMEQSVPQRPRIADTPERAPPAPIERPKAAPESRVAKPAASPASDCQAAGPSSRSTSCTNDNLAALDRLALTFYAQSLRAGNATKRATLLVSRNELLGRLKSCRSEPCLRGAYLTHMREISAIMESRPRL